MHGQGVSFPRQQARTRRFTLGRPRGVRVAADGSRVAFLRSGAGDDPVHGLWVLDVATGEERLAADPRALTGPGPEDLPASERARRERARESAAGIVSYGSDPLLRVATFALSGRLYAADLTSGAVTGPLPAPGPAVDPWPDPTARRAAYVCGRALHLHENGAVRLLGPTGVEGDDPAVSWGLPEFVAAEEMGRLRGHWWAPRGDRLAVARVDERGVRQWSLADPADPATPPRAVRYPAAGTANAEVTLLLVGIDGSAVEVSWDRAAFPYLARVSWAEGSPLTVLVQSRDQRTTQVLAVDPATGATEVCRQDGDPVWVDLVPGTPTWSSAGAIVHTAHDGDTRRLFVDGTAVTPPGLEVREVVDAAADIVFTASVDPAQVHVWRVEPGADPVAITTDPGVHAAARGGDVVVVTSSSLDSDAVGVEVRRPGSPPVAIPSFAERPAVTPRPRLLEAGARRVRTAVLLPTDDHGEGQLPVLLDPYGGPGHQRVVRSRLAFTEPQWWADQGFAVVVADGRGTGGRGRDWDRALHLDLAGPVLDDQVEALAAAAIEHPRLDLGRVAIRGWSFGGYLAALAVLRRPDVFHAAVAGAPVTDWRLYDTHYTERYLGHPDDQPEAYRRSSLLDDASRLCRPLLLVHGLADDNVVVAHTLRLSAALTAAGRPHAVLPLSGITHMASAETVAENLLLLQLDFIRRALGIPPALER
jgi:dipeptidyl-peptidase-4